MLAVISTRHYLSTGEDATWSVLSEHFDGVTQGAMNALIQENNEGIFHYTLWNCAMMAILTVVALVALEVAGTLGIVLSALILPRNAWTRDYLFYSARLGRRALAYGWLFFLYMLVGVLSMFYMARSRALPSEYLNTTILGIGLLAIASLSAFSHWVDLRWGLLAYLKGKGGEHSDSLRIIFDRFLSMALVVVTMFSFAAFFSFSIKTFTTNRLRNEVARIAENNSKLDALLAKAKAVPGLSEKIAEYPKELQTLYEGSLKKIESFDQHLDSVLVPLLLLTFN